MRHLASIQYIHHTSAIEGADRIELAHVLGWQVTCQKGQFKVGDLAVYFEIDSYLPVRPEFEYLRRNSYRTSPILGEGFRLHTMKFRGAISQGLLMPPYDFPELAGRKLDVGTDVTEILGVRKWEIEERATNGGTIIGELPAGFIHSDEVRVQAAPDLINAFHGIEYYISTKMDGSSHSCGFTEDGGFHVCGHNYEYADDGKSGFYELLKKRNLSSKLLALKGNVWKHSIILIGEFCGPSIQSNRLRLIHPEWYIFTVMVDHQRVGLREMQNIAKMLDNPTVPIEEIGTDFDVKYPTVETVLARADGFHPNGARKEGIVIRPTEPVFNYEISAALSMKAVSNKYLLKTDT